MEWNKDVLDRWHRFYEKLILFKNKYGHCDVPYDSKNDASLVKWVKAQRKGKHKLTAEQRNKLLSIDFNFSDSAQEWNKKYGQLAEFAKTYGHVHVPANDSRYSDLFSWLILQIKNQDYLNREQQQKLDYLGVVWDVYDAREWKWRQMYKELQEFYQERGHSRVPQKWPENPKLSNWILVQRRTYGEGKMKEDRLRKLEALEFVWDFKEVYEEQWEDKYKALLRFVAENGHCKPPLTHTVDNLGSWVDRQRTMNNKGKLPEQRKKKLDEVGFIWDCDELQEQAWEERFRQLNEYKQEYGDCMIPVNWKINRQLGTWVSTQRTLEKNGRLDPLKKERLEAVGFVWHGAALQEQQKKYDKIWERNFAKYLDYQKKYGKLQVSLKHDHRLQRWTCEQRKKWLSGKIDDDKAAKLTKANFPWNLHESYWMEKYRELVAFKKRFGHTRVHWEWEENPQLGQWVSRTRLHKYTLTPWQVEALNEIGFDWKTIRKVIVPWAVMYQSLVDFKESYGHTRVPVNWSQNRKLGKWISRIRSEQHKLEPERRKLLDSINFDWSKRRGRYKKEVQLESA